MNWLLFLNLNLLFSLSFQTQLFRDLAGLTVQNLQAQASQWILSDLSGTQYSPTIINCSDDETKIVVKPASLPSGTTFKKTFDNLEDHNVLRFFVKMYYMGDYTSQTVDIKFDGITFETSKVLPLRFPPEFFPCSSLTFAGTILYYGTIPHTDSTVTVEFSSNLHDTNIEINWGLRDFSLVADFADSPETVIYTQSFLSDSTGTAYPCFVGLYPDEEGNCNSCVPPCEICFGSDADQCFVYSRDSPEMRLCPIGQTFTTSGCTACPENCNSCDKDVSQCDTCLTTCAQCDLSGDTPQCQDCTIESNLVLSQGSCLPDCPTGTYADSDRKCQLCQAGCLECTSSEQCLQCDTSETHLSNDICICNQGGFFFERDSEACTGTCLPGCANCLNSQECLLCNPGFLIQTDGDCRCFQDGFYYQEETGLCTGQCYDYCTYCHDSSSCLECSGNRVPKDGMCKCESPRILIGVSCECPAYMMENPDTLNCEYIDLIDVAYQQTVSPLFGATLIVQMNPLKKWTVPVSISWMADCTFQSMDTRDSFQDYMSTQATDVLLIPSGFLEYSLQCAVLASYLNDNGAQISQALIFETTASSQAQVQIAGGPFQMFDHTGVNFILAEVKSSSGQELSLSGVIIDWTQTNGDEILDMNSIFNSSTPLQLKFPKCTLSKGKSYTFKLSVTMNGQVTSQEVTIGVYAPKVSTQIIGLDDNYHLSSQPLVLQAPLSTSDTGNCPQRASLSDLIDSSTAMYTWECFYLDLDLPNTNRILDDGTPQITDDSNIQVHPDPLKLFYHSTSSPTITIPNSYFTLYPNHQFIFYLTVTAQSTDSTPATISKFNLQQPSLYNSKNHVSVRIVTTKPSSIPTPSLTCMSENNCQAYSADFPTKFVSGYPKFNPSYSYDWQLNTFGAFSVKTSYSTFLTIYAIDSWGVNIVPQILFTISDGTSSSVASAFFILPWNNPPQNGAFQVYPPEGEAYRTKFLLSTSQWVDADLPVSYEFYTSYDSYKNMMMETLNPSAETILLPQPYYNYSYVGVLVKDNLKSVNQQTAFVRLTNEAHSLCEAIDKSKEALSLSQNLYQRFRLLQMIMENLNSWEWFDSGSTCNVTEIDFKLAIITEMRDIFLALDSKQELRLLLLASLNQATDPLWNLDSHWKLYIDIIDSIYQTASSTSILSPGEYNILFPIIDNLINYMKKPGTSIQNPAQIFTYINTLLRSTLYDVIPTDWEVAYYGTFYSYFTIKTTYCKVTHDTTSLVYGGYGLQTNVTLLPGKTFPSEKCNDQIDMIFMAFRPNYTIIEEPYEAMSLIYFILRDSATGKSLFDIFTFNLASPVYTCPDGALCPPGGNGGTEIYGIFDLRDQVNKIFAKSNIAQIQNISVLKDFHFWQSVAFWTVLAFSVWFLVSFYWLYIKHPTYCALKANKDINKQSLFKRINIFFWVSHPLVGIYLYNDPKIAKSTKLVIYYQRLVIVMVFSTIFSSIAKGEGAIFKGYIVLFNALTVTPVNAIFSRTLQWLFNNRKTTSNKKITPKITLLIGIFLYLSLLVACFIIMFIIEAQQDASENTDWALNFIIAFGQDLSLSPSISLLNKVSFLKLSQTGRFIKFIKSQRITGFFLPKNFRSIYQTIFVNLTITTTMDDCQSPRATTLSPLSSDRKLLRFSSAVDLQSPTSSQAHTPYEFRSRRASETEINTVDIMTTEALVSNRFQTYFSEAKPEMVKQFNPIVKENFTKMQSSNLYSSTYSNVKLQQSLVGNQKIMLTESQKFYKPKPMASILFHPETEPAEISPEEIFSFGENAETMYASQPKRWEHGKTMKSSIHEKTKKMKKDASQRCETVE